ncbi:MAG TPA: PIN domain-containing protein [Candidatus Sulfotelmatobacter sp.]|nr:PIN domain-containing protein [Candidatus Sulfotelmatobacter sp.]
MADKYFVDTNILIYAHDRSSGIKHQRARRTIERLWESGQGVLSTQVLQELCVNLRREVARPVSLEELRKLVRDYMSWEIVVNTSDAVLQALEIQERHRTSFWDALILQAAEQSGAAVLYSEDLTVSQNYGPVQVVNPLIASNAD